MRLLKIKSDIIKPEDLPEAFRAQNHTEFCAHLKGLEGEIINYALSVQKTSPVVPDKNPKLHPTDRQIDGCMQAIRASIYAAKSIKDISENIQ